MDAFFLNSFSLGALIPGIYVALSAAFLLNIRGKSLAAWMLAGAFFSMFLFYFPYFPAATYYDPVVVYHRWFTVPFVLAAGAFFLQFTLHFPEKSKHPRIAWSVLGVQSALFIGWSLYFYAQTYGAERIFHFDGHYWDYGAEQISKQTGLLILGFIVLNIIVGYIRSFLVPRGYRLALAGITTAFLIATIVPGFTNVLSRDGLLDRGLHQNAINICVVLGFFTYLIIFINTTRDRTTFMAKIVGVSIATFLLLMQGINYMTFQDKESAYDAIKLREAALVVNNGNRPEDLRYLVAFPLNADAATLEASAENDGFAVLYRSGAERADLGHARVEFRNSAMRARIVRAAADAETPEDFRAVVRRVASDSHGDFAGYGLWLMQQSNKLPLEEAAPDEYADMLFSEADALRGRIAFTRTQIGALPDEDFRQALVDFLPGLPDSIAPFRTAIEARLQALPGMEGAELKASVLDLLAPMKALGERHFRRHKGEFGPENRDQFIGFMTADWERNVIYEAGFSYLVYRDFIHESSFKVFGLLMVVLVVVLLGFRLFFMGALLRPLEKLLSGVSRVNEGDLDVQVPVKVEDEIGYISRTFNGMVQSIRVAKARLQEYADHLEEKVKERTAELKNTLDKVQELKKQQDGDYFLTSLLIKPLGANHAESRYCDVDFLLKQKKQFEFRKWNSEIGGDICIANHIRLRGRSYTVFLNADAMGKSIQGAGGALVLGSVFESILTRTKLSSEAQGAYPERWLKNVFVELHKVFESFDGCMLISLVLGLVDDEAGFVYYVNAEHPFTVVYRKGKADFIERELIFRKLGTAGMNGAVFIPTFQLEPGDQLIAGSDGRDDILLGRDEHSGDRIINEDETRFLTVVEEANGDLERIHELLEGDGELTDDLSLLRIAWRGDRRHPEDEETEIREELTRAREAARTGDWRAAIRILEGAANTHPENSRVLRELCGAFYKSGDFSDAARIGSLYVDVRPEDTEMIYFVSLCCKKDRDLKAAADLAERVRMRQPWNVKNLVHLADIYFHSGNEERAHRMLNDALDRDPDNENARKLLKYMEERSAAKPALP